MRLFEPYTCSPNESSTDHSGDITGERNLMLAVLRDAIDCYHKYARARDPHRRILFSEAAAWIESHDQTWPFSYENICDAFGLDPAYIRDGLSSWSRGRSQTPRTRPRIVPVTERRAGCRVVE